MIESRQRYQTIVDNINDALYIFDFEGNIIEVNENACKMLGYDRNELIGANLSKIDSSENGKKIPERIKIVLSNKSLLFEGHHIRKDGTSVPVEVSAKVVSYEGKGLIQGFARDITDRKLAEKALRESEEKFRNLAAQSPNMIFINMNGRIVYVNEKCTEITGYSREEFYAPDFDFLTLIAPEYIDLIKKLYRRHMKGEEIPPYEYAFLTKAGRKIDTINTTKLITYEGGRALLGIVTDISERKQTEQALRESEERFRKFADEAAFEGILIHDGEKIIDVNRQFAQMHGYEIAEIVSMSPYIALAPESS